MPRLKKRTRKQIVKKPYHQRKRPISFSVSVLLLDRFEDIILKHKYKRSKLGSSLIERYIREYDINNELK